MLTLGVGLAETAVVNMVDWYIEFFSQFFQNVDYFRKIWSIYLELEIKLYLNNILTKVFHD